MSPEPPEAPFPVSPLARLEQAFIAEFFAARGVDAEQLHEVPTETVHQLLKDAAVYASARLMEVESRARYISELHGGSPPL